MTVLKNMLLPIVLMAAGIALLILALRARIGGENKGFSKRQYISIGIGVILLFIGISIFLFSRMEDGSAVAGPPTILGVTIRKGLENGEMAYYQRINFYDGDGNTNTIEWTLLDLSDPSQRQYMQIESGVVSDSPEIQKIRSSIIRTWQCERHVYVATLEVTLLDADGNRSKPVRYTIDCK